jgi:hypothetical protein
VMNRRQKLRKGANIPDIPTIRTGLYFNHVVPYLTPAHFVLNRS